MVFLYVTALVLFLILCMLLCGVILMQEGKTTGLGASFGGESGESVFGTATADVLKKVTGIMVAIFFISCVVLSVWTSALGRSKVGTVNPFDVEQAEIEK